MIIPVSVKIILAVSNTNNEKCTIRVSTKRRKSQKKIGTKWRRNYKKRPMKLVGTV